jgi:hypothetical protein
MFDFATVCSADHVSAFFEPGTNSVVETYVQDLIVFGVTTGRTSAKSSDPVRT